MGIHVYMDIHGYTWIYMAVICEYMDIHGYTWAYMNIYIHGNKLVCIENMLIHEYITIMPGARVGNEVIK